METGQKKNVVVLHELSQKKGWTVEYQEVNIHGPDQPKKFAIRVIVKTCSESKTYPDGVGWNKKDAKENAAKNALSCLKKEEPVNSASSFCSSHNFVKMNQPNYICWLNEYAQKNKLVFSAKETNKMDLNTQFHSYVCHYICDGKEFPQALGKGKKEAKEAAAKLVYEELSKEQKTVVLDENGNGNGNGEKNPNSSDLVSTMAQLTLSSPESSTADHNFIGSLNEYCQNAKLVHDFKLVEKRGPDHNPEFVYVVVINKKIYPEGRGKNSKEAKQNAAQKACYKINEQSFLISQGSGQTTSAEDNSSSQTSNTESDDDFSSSKCISKSDSTGDSIIFKDSSVNMQNIISPLSERRPLGARPKRKLAANFQISPNRNKEEAPSMNTQNFAMPSKEVSTPKSRFLEEFNSITPIGKGGFGHVYKAKRELGKRYYAVKIVKYTDKACREVDALASLEHSNIVRYHTAWIEDTAYRDEASSSSSTSNSDSDSIPTFLYIQMEFCEGETLRAWIEERNTQSKQNAKRRHEAAQIMKQVLEAVKYVHDKKLIHRDLKPANIMIGHEGRVKVVDFGLVTVAHADSDRGPLERTNRTGTSSYMSPEQINSSYDKKVDIFALGLIYFELLWYLGTKTEKQKIWENIRRKDLPKNFHEKFGFEYKLIQQMLSYNPEERPDAIELFSQLEHITLDRKEQKENRTY